MDVTHHPKTRNCFCDHIMCNGAFKYAMEIQINHKKINKRKLFYVCSRLWYMSRSFCLSLWSGDLRNDFFISIERAEFGDKSKARNVEVAIYVVHKQEKLVSYSCSSSLLKIRMEKFTCTQYNYIFIGGNLHIKK